MNKILEEFIVYMATGYAGMWWWTTVALIVGLGFITLWRCPMVWCVPLVFFWVMFTHVPKESQDKQNEIVPKHMKEEFAHL